MITRNSRCVVHDREEQGPVTREMDHGRTDTALNGRTIGMPGSVPPSLTSTEVLVQAGEPVALFHSVYGFEGYARDAYCALRWAFTPEEGVDTRAIGDITGNLSDTCRLVVVAIGDQRGEYPKPLPVTNQYHCGRWQQGWLNPP